MAKTSPPLNFVAILYPGFQLLDLAGPIDVLNVLSIVPNSGLHDLKLTFVASTLDPVHTKAIPPKSGEWTFDTAVLASSDTSNGLQNRTFDQSIVPDATFESYLDAVSSGKTQAPDVIFIPGGVGVRLHRIYANAPDKKVLNVADAIDFLVKIQSYVKHSITTVCTGSWLLGQSGLLNHRRAITNVLRTHDVAEMNPHVNWQHYARWVKSSPDEVEVKDRPQTADTSPVFNGTIYTSAGVTAGIDMMLSLIADTVSLDLARRTAKVLEYDWSEIEEGKIDPLYNASGWKEHFDLANQTLGKWHGTSPS